MEAENFMLNLANKIEQQVNETDFSGVISVKKGNTDIYCNAFGYRDIKNELPNNKDTKLGIASGTKAFTALGIGKLIDKGDLSLETAVGDIDKDFEHFVDKKATILNILTHTSGIFDYYDEEKISDFENFAVQIPWSQLATPSDYLPLFKNKEMKFHPGERYSYSNGGFVFLGIIIEKISGKLYRDYITENVLHPLAMYNSGFFAFNDLPENTANGYLKDRRTTNIYALPIRGGGDGGMYTTANDLDLFWKKLISQSILSPGLTNEYLKTHYKFNDIKGYGCGIYKNIDDSAISIVGGDAGVGFFSRYIVKDDITISVLSNITNGEEGIANNILQSLDGS